MKKTWKGRLGAGLLSFSLLLGNMLPVYGGEAQAKPTDSEAAVEVNGVTKSGVTGRSVEESSVDENSVEESSVDENSVNESGVEEDTSLAGASAAGVKINWDNFPDPDFNWWISYYLDTNSNKILSPDEIKKCTEIRAPQNTVFRDIDDLTGIEYLTSLKILDCSGMNLKELNISKNRGLQELYCSRNQLSQLDISQNTSLKKLGCSENPLTQLDISQNNKLIYLDCSYTEIPSLDFRNTPQLKVLFCYFTPFSELDTSLLPNLISLLCSDTKIKYLDISYCSKLEEFEADPDTEYYYLDQPQITEAKAITSSQVRIRWKEVPRAAGYRIYRKEGGDRWEILNPVFDTVGDTYLDETAAEGKTYQYTVQAVKPMATTPDVVSTYDETGTTVTVPVGVTEAVVPIPTLSFKSATTSSITLNWKKCDSTDGYALYGYNYNTKTKAYSQHYDTKNVVKSTSDLVSFTAKKLKPGTIRRYMVRSYQTVNGKNLYSKNSNWAYAASLPGNGVIKTAKVKNDTIAVTLKTKSSGAYGYAYCYGKSAKWSSAKDYTIAAKGPKTPYTMKNIPNGTWYVRVRPYVNVNGKSKYGAWSGSKKVIVNYKKPAVLKKHIGTDDPSFAEIGSFRYRNPDGSYTDLGNDFLDAPCPDGVSLYDRKYRITQAGCIDKAGNYLYYLIRNQFKDNDVKHAEWGKSALVRVSLNDWTVEVLGDKLSLGHANDMTYYKGKLIVVHSRNSKGDKVRTITALDPDNLSASVLYPNSKVVLKDNSVGLRGIAYNPSKDQFVLAFGDNGKTETTGNIIGFAKFDGKKFTEVGNRFRINKDNAARKAASTRYAQGIECSANGIYLAFSPRSYLDNNTNCIITYNWKGDFKEVTTIDGQAEIENLSRVYGSTKFYAAYCAASVLPGVEKTGIRVQNFELNNFY